MKPTIIIVDSIHDSIFDPLKNIGYEVVYIPEATREDIKMHLKNATGMIIRSKTTVDEDLLKHAQGLRFVGRAGAGLDLFDLTCLKDRNIEVLSSPEGNRDAVAEHAVGMILAVLNHFKKSDQQLRSFKWLREDNRGLELSSLTVGIIGYGNIGQAFAERLKSFGCRLLAYDKYKSGFGGDLVEEVEMDAIYNEVDILSLHIPLTKETDHMVNERFINSFRKPILLINTSRGAIADWNIFPQFLENGKLLGLGLDVLPVENPESMEEQEKKLFTFLVKNPNVIMTPHVAGWTKESLVKINLALVEKITKLSQILV